MSAVQQQFDGEEERALIAGYGPTIERECRFELDRVGYDLWLRATALQRRAEVVMIVQRPDGRLLLHAKGHYPPGTYRLPSGGVRWDEGVLEALDREQWEELGLHLPVEAMPGFVRYTLHHDGHLLHFASYLFLLRAERNPVLSPQDPTEAIAEFRWLDLQDLPTVAEALRGSPHGWRNWGPFRAVAHDLLAERSTL
jgi:8-oxo-dGTP pyrophosphatase MutT (NUDIX family)